VRPAWWMPIPKFSVCFNPLSFTRSRSGANSLSGMFNHCFGFAEADRAIKPTEERYRERDRRVSENREDRQEGK